MSVRKKKNSMQKSKKSTSKKVAETRKSRTVIRSMPEKKMHLGMHLLIAGSAVGVLLLLSTIDRVHFSTLRSRAQESLPTTIGLEHDLPLKMGIVLARKASTGYASITNDSDAAIRISLPMEWQRTEVTGAPIANVTRDSPVFGFTRYSLPPHTGLKMLLPVAPDALLFESKTSIASAAIDLQTVDLGVNHSSRQIVLLQSQALVTLWEAE